MQTNAPKRGSDFPYQRNQSFGSSLGFTQTVKTGSSLSWSRDIALSSYVASVLCIWAHSLQAVSQFDESRNRQLRALLILWFVQKRRVSRLQSVLPSVLVFPVLRRTLVILFRNL